jgi:hypothetical protein
MEMPTTVSRGRTLIARVLCIGGLAGMFLGVLDPLEGSGAILAGTGLVAPGAFLGKSRFRRLMYLSLVLVFSGVAALWMSSAVGGFGGDTGHPDWWGLLVVPYAVGGVMGLVGAVCTSVEALRRMPC